jgi:hypothetical protein
LPSLPGHVEILGGILKIGLQPGLISGVVASRHVVGAQDRTSAWHGPSGWQRFVNAVRHQEIAAHVLTGQAGGFSMLRPWAVTG